MVKQRVTSAASEEDDGEQFCPLCLEVLDLTDRSFRPCQCGYQVCLWCFHHIKEKVNGLCPACRTPYEEGSFNALDPKLQAAAEAERRRKRDRDRIERATAKAAAAAAAVAQTAQSAATVEATRDPGAVDRATLQNVRVMQRNLVYVTGIPPSIAREDILRRKEHFGRFGRIVKIALNRKSGSANNYSAYVTFKRNADASECISQVSGSAHDGATIRATFGTTKYCSLFLRNAVCNNSNCLYLHELAKEGDCFRKEDLQHDVQLDEFEMDHAAPNRPISEPVVATAPPPQDTDRSPASVSSVPQSTPAPPRIQTAPLPVKQPVPPPISAPVSAPVPASQATRGPAFNPVRSTVEQDVSLLPGISALGLGKADQSPFGWEPHLMPARASQSAISPPESPRSRCRAEQQDMFRSLLPNIEVSFMSNLSGSGSDYNLFGSAPARPNPPAVHPRSRTNEQLVNSTCGAAVERPSPPPFLPRPHLNTSTFWDPAILSCASTNQKMAYPPHNSSATPRPPPPGLAPRFDQGRNDFRPLSPHLFNPPMDGPGVIRRSPVEPGFHMNGGARLNNSL